MADYYTIEQLAHKLSKAVPEISELLTKSSFSPCMKNGRNYYSARQVYQLQAALRLARKHRVSFDEALHMVFSRASCA
ncbi:MAG: hypothetical protein M1453_08100 [Acidobacteria bacterium]|nr:hypothetical protein [Acidobacteriota bacterium]MCL5287939.1 hypothetical protein [Acidobacteriota bacterium]